MIPESMLSTLIQKANVPIVAPSANITERKTEMEIKNIIKAFNHKVDYIIDSGDVENLFRSTIVKVEDDKICIQREGRIKKESIQKIGQIKE